MKVDWKKVAASPGYRSLKAAMIADITKSWRSKKESHKKFKWVISRAMHYAHFKQIPLEEVLNEWEKKRDYWWLNYYQECRQPKLRERDSHKPSGIRGWRKHLKHPVFGYRTEQSRKAAMLRFIRSKQKSESTKGRWDPERRSRARVMRKYRTRKKL